MTEHRHRLREFESLRAVITTGTTIGAARRLGISQSAVSQAMANLEHKLDTLLFHRKPLKLTEAGMRLLSQL